MQAYDLGRLAAVVIIGGGIVLLVIRDIRKICKNKKREKEKRENDKVQLGKYNKTRLNEIDKDKNEE